MDEVFSCEPGGGAPVLSHSGMQYVPDRSLSVFYVQEVDNDSCDFRDEVAEFQG